MRGDSKQEGDEESKLTVSCANDVEGIRVRKRGDSREEEAKGFKSLNWNWDFQSEFLYLIKVNFFYQLFFWKKKYI